MSAKVINTKEPQKPPSTEVSLLAGLFDHERSHYWLLLEALWDGLLEYEDQRGEMPHASTLPAA